MQIDPSPLSPRELHQLIGSIVVPRPIAFVSTVGKEGTSTVAPFSFFNAISSSPPVLAVSVGKSRYGKKTTLLNIEETGEFVVNIVVEEIINAVSLCGDAQPRSVSKIELAKLTPLPSVKVKPPRIAESPVNIECRLSKLIDIDGATTLIIGNVLHIHVRDEIISDGKVDPRKLVTVGRLSGKGYCRTNDLFEA